MLFNGTSSIATTGGLGGISSTASAATTFAVINRRVSTGRWDNLIGIVASGGGNSICMEYTIGDVITMDTPAGASTGPDLTTSGSGWYYTACDKPAGTSAARFHVQKYGADAAVSHSNGSGSITGVVARHHVAVGAFDSNSDWFSGDMQALAVWNRQLADWEHEWLAADLSAWWMLNPDWLAFGDWATLPSSIPDFSANGGAPLSTLTSLAATTASMPVGYGAPALVVTRDAGSGAQTINPAHVASTAQTFSPTFAMGGVTVTPGTIASGSQVFAPTLTSNINLQPARVESTEQTFAPTLSPGAVTIQPGHVASTEQVFAPSLSGGNTLTPGFVASGAQVFAPTFAVGAVTVTPGFLAAGSQVFQPTLTGGDLPEGPTPGTMMPTLGVG